MAPSQAHTQRRQPTHATQPGQALRPARRGKPTQDLPFRPRFKISFLTSCGVPSRRPAVSRISPKDGQGIRGPQRQICKPAGCCVFGTDRALPSLGGGRATR
ncbi:hypothetical protein LY78DRAFT_660097 [Colletotrichum sublineola]|nr:hypothetical protein LY78DRAFT_660097 [Colletotrichum sublineola]